ncbi:MAG: exopolysaccharide biosynthesis protein [Burkholderiaceae bacterium]
MQDQSMAAQLDTIIKKLPSDRVTLAKILDMVGDGGLLILTGLLSLVFLIPVSIPGVSTVFGAAILLIAVSRLFRRNLWLPKSVQQREIASDKLGEVLQRAMAWLQRLEKIARPNRLKWLASGTMDTFNNLMLILGALLLMAPFGFIPFSNTLPAVALIFLVLGLLQRDGACILLGYLSNLATIVYFGVLIAGGGMVIQQTFRHFSG